MYENDCDFLIDDYGILLDRSPGSLLLDENGIVQDGRNDGPEHSSIFWQSDGGFGDHPEISDFKTEMHQNLLEECGLPETRYCISDLELSDEEKSFPDKLENISPDILFDDRNGFCLQLNCQSVELKPRDSESCQKYSLQHFKESLDVSKDKSNNSFDEDPLAALLVKHEEPFDIHENSDEVCEDGEFLGNKEFFVKNYYTCYQNPSEMVRIPSLGGKLSSSAVKGLSPSETGMEKENYPNKEFCRESDEDELFLITGHIDFSEEKPFQQESEDLALRSLKVSESGQRSDKTISSKHSTEIFPEIFNVSNSGNENNFNHCRSSVNPVEDLQIPSPYDKEQIKETGESNPDFTFWNYSSTINSSVSENRFNELKDQSQKYFDDCTPNLHDVHCINTTDGQFDIERKNMFALSAVPQDKNEINSTGRLHANTFLIKDFTNLKTMQNDYMDQELSNSKSGMTADEICQELPDKTTTSLIQHESAVDVSNNCCKRKNSCGKMDKVENKIKFPESKEVTLEEREKGKDGEVKKEEEVDSRTWPTSGEILKSSRIKSKSVTDVSCHLTPVKSKHKSLIELNKLQTDQGSSENLSTFSSVMELNDKLVQESEKRRKATELVEELQNQYSDLLTRYADAANTIDEMRLGASSAPLLSSRNGSQTFMNNINFCRPLVTSTPLHSAFLANQDSRNEGCMKSGFHGNSESKKFQQEGNHDLESQKYVSKAESIKITLLKEARNLEKMMNSLETLLEQNQLTRKEQKKFIEKVCTEQNKQRRQYLRIKEEFVIGSAANGNIFDEDKELEGYLFDLQMRFDELEDKYQTLQDNLKEPFQSGDSCSPVDSLDGTKESENVPEDGMINDSYEARKGKFLVQYNVLMDKYWQLKLSGSLDDGDQEMKEITEKLRQIKKELCQNEQHQQQQQQREHNIHKTGMDSGILVEMVKAKKITVEGGTQQNLALKNEPNKNFRVSRCLPEVPENKTGTRNKKCDEVSSTTSVPDSGISDVWNLSLPPKQSRQSMPGLLPLTKFTDTNKEHPINNPEVVSKQTDAISLNRTGQTTPMDTTSRARSDQTVPMAVEPAARTDHSATSTDKGTLVRNDPCTMSTNQELMSRVNQQQHVQSSLALPRGSQHHLTSDAGVQSQHSFVIKQKAKEKQTNEEENEEEEGSKLWQPKMARSTTASKMVSTSEPLSESSSSIESTEDAATQMSDPHSSSRRSRIISQSSSKFRRNSDVVFCKKTRNASKKFSIESAQGGTKSVVGLPKRSTAMSHSMSQDTKKKDPIPTFIKTSPNRKKLEALQQEIEFLKETFNRRISRHNPKFENAEINDSKAENLQPLTHHFSSTTSTDNPPNPYIPTQINKSAKYPPRHPVINSNASSNHQTTTFFTDDPKLNLAKYNIERNSQMSSSPDHSGTTGVYQIKPQQPKTMMRTMMTPAPNLVNTPYYTPNRIYHGIYKERQPPPRVQAISCNKSSQFQQSIDHYNDGTQPLTNHRSSSRFATPMMDSFKENIQYGSAHWNQQVEPKYIAAQRSGGEMSSFITKPYSSAIIEDKYDYGTAPLMQSNRNNAFYASQDEPDVGTMYSLDDCCKVTKCIHHGHMCSAAPIYRKADMNSQIFWGGATDPRNCQLLNPDFAASIDVAARTAKDINRLTKKMMRTMYGELRKTKRDCGPYPYI